jgi:hypothetical protein
MNYFLNYATDKFFDAQNASVECARNDKFDCIFAKRFSDWPLWIYMSWQDILDEPRGAGCCLWKPYFILEIFNKMNYGDFILYMDSSDNFKSGLKDFILNHLNEQEQFFVENIWLNKVFTRRNCFKLMNCDEEKYWNHQQLEAGCIGLIKNNYNINFVNEWLTWNSKPDVAIDLGTKETDEDNFPEYKRHSCDQSILTNMIIRENLKTTPIYDVLKYIEYNKYG